MTDEILRRTQSTLSVTFYAGGVATSADGAVTVVALGANSGTVAAGTAVAVGTASPGAYNFTLAPQTDLDWLDVTWSGSFGSVAQSVVTEASIVGDFYVALSDIRALDSLSDATKYPIARLAEAREWFADKVEGFCDVSFVPRYCREVLNGDDTQIIILDHTRLRTIQSASVDGVTVTDLSKWYALQSGLLARDDGGYFPAGWRNIIIEYEYGYDSPPAQLREAALTAIRYKLLGDHSGIPERATSMTSEVGTYTLSLAGANRPFGIPEVDSVLLALGKKAPNFR